MGHGEERREKDEEREGVERWVGEGGRERWVKEGRWNEGRNCV